MPPLLVSSPGLTGGPITRLRIVMLSNNEIVMKEMERRGPPRLKFKVAHFPVLASLDRGNRFCVPLQRRLFNSKKPAVTTPAQERSAAKYLKQPCDES